MEVIKDFLAEYYWIFLIVGVVLLIVLIGFISSTKKKKEEEAKSNAPEIPKETSPVQETIQQPVIQPTQINETPQDTFEPSLDSFSSTATEVNVGFEQSIPSEMSQVNITQQVPVTQSINQSEPILAEPQVGLVIEDKPSVSIAQPEQNYGQVQTQSVNQPDPIQAEPTFGLVIEDKPSVSTTTQTLQTQSVNQPDPIEAEPTIGLVIEDTGKTVGTTIN